MDPYQPLYEFLRNSPEPTVPIDYTLLRVVDIDEDGKLFTRVEKDYQYGWPESWWNELQRISSECEEKARWYKEAQRQVYVQEVKKELQKKTTPQEYESKMVALTLNPPPDYSTVEYLQIFVDIVKSVSAVLSGAYVFEQRSQGSEQEHGWHLHFSINTTYAPSKVKQFVKQKLESRGYKMQMWATPDDGGFRNKYMHGVKNHASKDPKVRKDFELREKYGLEHFYEF